MQIFPTRHTRNRCASLLAGAIALAGVTSIALAAEDPGTGIEAPRLSLQAALARAIERNLDLRVEEINVPINREDVVAADAAFDPEVDGGLDTGVHKTPTASAVAGDDADFLRSAGVDVGLRRRFRFGLDSRLSVQGVRSSNSSAVDTLEPQYRSVLALDLTQPLLRDSGTAVNTADLRVSENGVRQATWRSLARAQRVGEDVERTYWDLSLAVQILESRVASRELARELAEGNRQKLDAGSIPITEVQEAETAVASRDEQVVAARQQVEVATARLRDLLEIRRGDPAYVTAFATEPLPGANTEVPGLEEALARALDGRPDLRAQLLELESRDIRVAFYQNQKLPRLDLEATLGVNGLSGEGRGTAGSSSYDGNAFDSVSSAAEGDGYEWFAGVRFSIPLGNRAAEARYRRAGWEKRQELYRLKRLETTVETEVDTSRVTATRSLERVQVADRFAALAQTTLEQEQERLRAGLSNTFRILQFQDDVIEARIRSATALADFHRGLASLYRAMGENLERYDIVYRTRDEENSYGTL